MGKFSFFIYGWFIGLNFNYISLYSSYVEGT
jgi:hypothetical protein